MSLSSRIEEVLEHYDYALITTNKFSFDNSLNADTTANIGMIFRTLTIKYGADRVSKTRKGIKIIREIK